MSDTNSRITSARFSVGDLVQHRLFGYRGVVIDIDPEFAASEEWYAIQARSKPPKNKPWYHVLVHQATHTTYVAERNLQADSSAEPIRHPLLEHYFAGLADGRYVRGSKPN